MASTFKVTKTKNTQISFFFVILVFVLISAFSITLSGCNKSSLEENSNASQNTHSVTTENNQLTGKLNITGSSTIAPLAAELARKFEIIHPQLRINVQTGGSSRGLADSRQGTADIGMVSRKLKQNENDVQPHLLAKDGVAIIVHKDNPITSLSIDDIKSIYLGKITNWKELSDNTHNATEQDKKITVINKAEGRSTLDVFLKFFEISNQDIKPSIVIGDNEQGIKLVSRNPYAIAYVSIGTAEYNVKAGTTIKTLPLNGVPATTEKLASGEFPLSRELNFVTKGDISPLAQAFIDFSQSNKAKDTIHDFGFVPINPLSFAAVE